jgi:hypothetical protein
MSRTRMSRGLVACIGVAIVLGAVAILHKGNKSNAEADKSKDLSSSSPTAQQQPSSPQSPAKPVDSKTVASATPKQTGQISLPGSAKTLVTTTPGNDPAKTAPASPGKPTSPSSTEKPFVSAPPTPSLPSVSGDVIAAGKAKIDSGDLFGGRAILNEALIGGKLSDSETQTVKELISKANEVLIFTPRRVLNDPFTGSYSIQPGDRPGKIAAMCETTWDFLGRINGIHDPRRLRPGQTLKTIKGPFHAVVTKSKFTMDMYLGSPGERGSLYIKSFGVGLGKHGSTPTGTWMVAPSGKLKDPKWWGTADEPAREAGDPQNPLGKFWLGLNGTDGDAVGKEGFGIHGTIDPDSIGKEMSHGCIRLINDDVEQVYEMLIDGKSTIIVKE